MLPLISLNTVQFPVSHSLSCVISQSPVVSVGTLVSRPMTRSSERWHLAWVLQLALRTARERRTLYALLPTTAPNMALLSAHLLQATVPNDKLTISVKTAQALELEGALDPHVKNDSDASKVSRGLLLAKPGRETFLPVPNPVFLSQMTQKNANCRDSR